MAEKTSGLRPPSRISRPSGIPKAGGGSNAPSITSATASTTGTSFSIGDKVLVSGTKLGRIEFLGPTQFAPGDWAGVVLDNEEGKNDGSVAGVRYFQCEPLHGIFSRPGKLTKFNEKRSIKSPTGSRPTSAGTPKVKSAPLTAASLKARDGAAKDMKPKSGMRSPASSIRSLKYGTPSRPSTASAVAAKQDFEIGDKVIVNGVKIGFARFVGEADFAKGSWVGVELDSPLGKNDGSVMGKRYFTCEMLYGLFAPLHKVKKYSANTPKAPASKAVIRETASSIARKKAIASASSMKSPASSVASFSTTGSFAGAKPKNLSSEVSSRYQKKTTATGTSALKEALKEKEQHVESLMVERDLERAEMMQATQDAAMIKKELDETKELINEKELELDALKTLVEQADLEKVSLRQQLEEQSTKVEDLQFRLEEEAINRDDMQSELKKAREKVRELDASVNIERNRSHILQTDLENTRASGIDDKSALDTLNKEREAARATVEELQTKLKQAEDTLQSQAKSGDDIDAFEDRISELMQELEREKMKSEDDQREIESYKLKLETYESEKITFQELVEQLKAEQSTLSEERDSLQFAVDELKLGLEDKEKALSSSRDHIIQLKKEKNDLEQEKEEILKGSGDSSDQLVLLNNHLREKDKNIEQLNLDLKDTRNLLAEMKVKHEALTYSHSSLEITIPDLKCKLEESAKNKERLENDLRLVNENVKTLSSELKNSLASAEKSSVTLKNVESEKNSLELKLEEAKKQSESLQEEIRQRQRDSKNSEEQLSEKLCQATSKFDELKKKYDEELTEKEYLNKKNKAMQDKVIELSEQIQNLSKTHEETKTTLTQLQEQSGEDTKNLLKQLQEQRDANEKMRCQFSESTRHINEIMEQKNALEEELDDAKSEVESLKTKYSTAHESLEKAETEVSEKAKQLKVLSADLEEVNLKIQKYESDFADEIKAKSDLQSELEVLKSEKAKVDATLGDANKGIELSRQKVEELQTTLEEAKQNHSYVELALQNAESENVSLTKQLEDAKSDMKQKDEKGANLLQHVETLTGEVEELRVELKSVTEKNENGEKMYKELAAKHQASDERCAGLHRDLTCSKNHCQDKDKEIIDLKSKIDGLTSDHALRGGELESVLKERDQLSTSARELSEKLRNLDAEKTTLQRKLDALSEQHGSTEQKSFELLDEIQTLKETNGRLEVTIESLKDDCGKTEVLKSELQTKHDALCEKCGKLEEDLAMSAKNCKDKEESIAELITKTGKLANDISLQKSELEVSNKSRDEAKASIEEVYGKLRDLETEKRILQQKLDSVSEQQGSAEQKSFELLDKIQEHEKVKGQMEYDLENKKIEIANLSAELTNLKSEFEQVSEAKSASENKLVSDLEATKTEKESANRKIQELIEQLNQTGISLESARASEKSLQNELEKANAGINLLTESKNSAEQKISNLENDKADLVSSSEEKIQNLSQIITAKEQENCLLKSKIGELNLQYTSEQRKAEEKYTNLCHQSDASSHELSALKDVLRAMEDENTSLKEKFSDLQNKFDALSNELSESKAAFESTEAKKRSLEERFGDVNHEFDAVRNELMSLKALLEAAETKNHSLEETFGNLNHKYDAVSNEVSSLKLVLEATEAEKSSIQEQYVKSSYENGVLQQSMHQLRNENAQLSEKVKTLAQTMENESTSNTTSIQSLSEEVVLLKSQLANAQQDLESSRETHAKEIELELSKSEELGAIIQKVTNEKLELESVVKSLQVERDSLLVKSEQLQNSSKNESSAAEDRLKSLSEEKATLLAERDSNEADLEKLKKLVLENAETDKQHRSKILILEADTVNYKEQLRLLDEKHDALSDIHEKVQAKLLKMEKSTPDIQERENVLKREFARERESMQQTIDITTALVEETRSQSESFQNELSLLKTDLVLAENLKEALRNVEKERDNLAIEVHNLKSLPTSQSGSTEDSGVGADEALRGQVDFLNSVIADQQSRIGDLNEKIIELEQMLVNGEDIDPTEVTAEYNRQHSDHARAAPRLFCDICDIFDAHDTDDCPTQSSAHYDNDAIPPPVHNVTSRGEERAYCENCEMFGHDTADCTEEDEMY